MPVILLCRQCIFENRPVFFCGEKNQRKMLVPWSTCLNFSFWHVVSGLYFLCQPPVRQEQKMTATEA